MLEIVLERQPTPQSSAAILDGLVAFNHAQTEGRFGPPFSFLLAIKDPDTDLTQGGLTGRIAYGWTYVELLYLPDTLRGQGLGEKLMVRAEEIAREHGCVGIRLETMSFQAPEFYRKLGYAQFGVLNDYPPGFTRHFLHKPLS